MRNPRYLSAAVIDLDGEEFDALPVGAQVRDISGRGNVYAKTQDGRWTRPDTPSGASYHQELHDIAQANPGGVRVDSLPGATEAEMLAAGIGSIVQVTANERLSYIKEGGGRWRAWRNDRTTDSTYETSAFRLGTVEWARVVVGGQADGEPTAVTAMKQRLKERIDRHRSQSYTVPAEAAWVHLGIDPLPEVGAKVTHAMAMIGLPPGSVVQHSRAEAGAWWLARVRENERGAFGRLESLHQHGDAITGPGALNDETRVTVVAIAGTWPLFERPRQVLEAAWALADPMREHFSWCSWVFDTLTRENLRPEDAPEPEPEDAPAPEAGVTMQANSPAFAALPSGSTFRSLTGRPVIKANGAALYVTTLTPVDPVTMLTLAAAAPQVEVPF